jgi:hypothetical protein
LVEFRAVNCRRRQMSDICPTSSKRVRLDDAPARVLVQRSAVTFVQMVGEDYSIKAYCVEHESSELADELFTWIHSFDADEWSYQCLRLTDAKLSTNF